MKVYMFGVTDAGSFVIPKQPLSVPEFSWVGRDIITGEWDLHEMRHRPTEKDRNAKRVFQVAQLLMEHAWAEATP